MRDDDKPDDEDEAETITAVLRVIVSYDAGKRQRAEAVAIHRFVHGRMVTMRIEGRRKRYYYPGLISRPGVDKIGQSVLLMKEKDAEDFAAVLKSLHVPCTWRRVWVKPVDLF